MKLIDLLLLNGSLKVGKRIIKPRFIIILLIIILILILILNANKLRVDSYFTSVYWSDF